MPRSEIKPLKALLDHRFVKEQMSFDERHEALDKQEKDLHQYAYEAAFSKQQIDKTASIPNGWMPKAKSVRIRIESKTDPNNSAIDEEVHWAHEEDGARPVPLMNYTGTSNQWHRYNQAAFARVIHDDHPYVVARAAYKAAETALRKEEEEYAERRRAPKYKALRITESVTTVKRLIEVWPEVKDFLPEIVSGEGGGVPAELIANINKDFGIG